MPLDDWRRRHMDITAHVLGGFTLEAVGASYGLSHVRIRAIVHQVCRQLNPSVYRTQLCLCRGRQLPRLRFLRAHVEDFGFTRLEAVEEPRP